MALELVYEGIVSGTKNVSTQAFSKTSIEIVAGRICCLTNIPGTITAGLVRFSAFLNTTHKPFGLVADNKEDTISSGKVSIYFTPGLYKTDQISGIIIKGDLLTYTSDGLLVAMSGQGANAYIVGICTEAADVDGMIEMMLNISGVMAAS